MKEIYKKLNFFTAVWWLFLIWIFLAHPLYQASKITSVNSECIGELGYWIYPLTVFMWDWVIIIGITAISLIGFILTKVHNTLTK